MLANIAVCDLLLRLAETPRLYIPGWSSEILEETRRVQSTKLNWPPRLVESWRREVERSFPDSLEDGYAHLIEQMTNHEKDRHVLAGAIESGATWIVTFNLKDFPAEALSSWQVEAIHPQDFLIILFCDSPEVLVRKLTEMASDRSLKLPALLDRLQKPLPAFGDLLMKHLEEAS